VESRPGVVVVPVVARRAPVGGWVLVNCAWEWDRWTTAGGPGLVGLVCSLLSWRTMELENPMLLAAGRRWRNGAARTCGAHGGFRLQSLFLFAFRFRQRQPGRAPERKLQAWMEPAIVLASLSVAKLRKP